jgi:hypothetical protein
MTNQEAREENMGKKMFSIQREETIVGNFRIQFRKALADQEVEKEIKATGSGRRDTMSRVIIPPDNGIPRLSVTRTIP